MTMQRWDPFNEMFSLRQAMNRLMEDAVIWPGRTQSGTGTNGFGIPIDIAEHDNELVVEASLPGLRPEDISLTVQGNTLTLQGETREEEKQPQGQHNGQQGQQRQSRYHYRERRYGRFYRQTTLPVQVDPKQTEARFENGVLTMTLPKAPEARQRRIAITAGGQAQQLTAGRTR